MSSDDRGLFAERGARPRSRRDDATAPSIPAVDHPPPAPDGPPPDASAVLRDVRNGVRATIDEWLSERSNTISLAVTQVVEDALTRLQAVHAARLRELESSYEEKLAALERERSEVARGVLRRRRARIRAVERELRERIESLERSLTEATLESVERLRDVERRETDRRLELERAHQQALREKDEEIARLRRGGVGPDESLDALAAQLRSRRPDKEH